MNCGHGLCHTCAGKSTYPSGWLRCPYCRSDVHTIYTLTGEPPLNINSIPLAPSVIPPTNGDQNINDDYIWIIDDDDDENDDDDDNDNDDNNSDETYQPPGARYSDRKSNAALSWFGRVAWELYNWQLECVNYGCTTEERREVSLNKRRRTQRPYAAALVEALRRRDTAMPIHMCRTCFRETTEGEETTALCCGRVMCTECVLCMAERQASRGTPNRIHYNMGRCPACGGKARTALGLLSEESPNTDATNVVENCFNFVANELHRIRNPSFTNLDVKFVKIYWGKLIWLHEEIGERNRNLKNFIENWNQMCIN